MVEVRLHKPGTIVSLVHLFTPPQRQAQESQSDCHGPRLSWLDNFSSTEQRAQYPNHALHFGLQLCVSLRWTYHLNYHIPSLDRPCYDIWPKRGLNLTIGCYANGSVDVYVGVLTGSCHFPYLSLHCIPVAWCSMHSGR